MPVFKLFGFAIMKNFDFYSSFVFTWLNLFFCDSEIHIGKVSLLKILKQQHEKVFSFLFFCYPSTLYTPRVW